MDNELNELYLLFLVFISPVTSLAGLKNLSKNSSSAVIMFLNSCRFVCVYRYKPNFIMSVTYITSLWRKEIAHQTDDKQCSMVL